MIPLYKPYMPEKLPELDSILHSGALAYGKYGREFEQCLSSFLHAENLVLVNSFNSAVLVALFTLGIKPGDEVIASPMACLASNQPLVTNGAKVVWADVVPTTGTLNPESVKQRITKKTKAIFHNHFCGYPGYIDEIKAIGAENGVVVIDDAIEAFGSEYKGLMIGNLGADVTIYSFQAVRLPTTIDGGALVFKDKSLYEKSLMVRDSGVDRRYFRDSMGEINPDCDITVPGFGATMSEANSYIGIRQMDELGFLLEKQRSNASDWTDWLSEYLPNNHRMNIRHEINPNYWIFGFLAKNKRETIRFFREKGIYASGVHLPNNLYSIFGDKKPLPGVNEFYNRFVAIPSGWWVSDLKSKLKDISMI